MEEDIASTDKIVVSLYMTEGDRELLNRAAKAEDRSRNKWALRVLRAAAHEVLKKKALIDD